MENWRYEAIAQTMETLYTTEINPIFFLSFFRLDLVLSFPILALSFL